MTIDKRWTTLRNRNSNEFWEGLQTFLLRCKNHLNEYDRCRCPCNVCNNLERGSLQSLESHIHKHGFSKAYKTWTYHGEVEVPPVFQYTSQTTNEMRDVVTDIRLENTTIERNTSTDETRNEPHECLNATNDDLDELITLADTELYPGCDWMSSLDFLAKISHMKVINKWTDTSFDQLLEFLRSAFPKENKIPKSHYEAKKLMKNVRLGYESIQETGQYPSRIEGFGNMHQKDGIYNSHIAQQHEAMQQLWDAQSNNPNPMSEEQIMEQVLGSRRGHNRGRGRIVRGTSSLDSTAQSHAPGRVYNQAEVDAMFVAQQSQMQSQLQSQLQAFAQTLSAQIGFNIPVPSPTPPPPPPHHDNNTDDPYA